MQAISPFKIWDFNGNSGNFPIQNRILNGNTGILPFKIGYLHWKYAIWRKLKKFNSEKFEILKNTQISDFLENLIFKKMSIFGKIEISQKMTKMSKNVDFFENLEDLGKY